MIAGPTGTSFITAFCEAGKIKRKNKRLHHRPLFQCVALSKIITFEPEVILNINGNGLCNTCMENYKRTMHVSYVMQPNAFERLAVSTCKSSGTHNTHRDRCPKIAHSPRVGSVKNIITSSRRADLQSRVSEIDLQSHSKKFATVLSL